MKVDDSQARPRRLEAEPVRRPHTGTARVEVSYSSQREQDELAVTVVFASCGSRLPSPARAGIQFDALRQRHTDNGVYRAGASAATASRRAPWSPISDWT